MEKEKYKIGIVGAGFVGSACEIGFDSIAECVVYDKFKNTESLETVVEQSDIIFLCLPTPMDGESGECKTNIIQEVVEEISLLTDKRKVLIVKSTVPPGTTDALQQKYEKFTFMMNPEFLTEANFIEDFATQDRIIVGLPTPDQKHSDGVSLVGDFYLNFTKTQKNPGQVYFVKNKEAETIKYIGNCFLATKISFFNEVYEICKAADIEYKVVSYLACKDKRIGTSHTAVPGPDGQKGFSKSCLPKDINAFIYYAKEQGVDPLVLETVWTKNLLVREKHDWKSLPQINGKYKKR